MKLVILAGGFGTRLGQYTQSIPKPMVKIGERPIIWHIMKYYSTFGIKDFVIALGYQSEVIKQFFLNYQTNINDFTINLKTSDLDLHTSRNLEDWNVTLIDTGLNALKGARLKKIEPYLNADINLLTYGDGLSNIDLKSLIDFHLKHDKTITISGVHPPARFGELIARGDIVETFAEKSQTSQGMINGGYMVFNKRLLQYLNTEDSCDLEAGVFEMLATKKEIAVYKHDGFWGCVDHERDLKYLEKLWNENKAFWKVW